MAACIGKWTFVSQENLVSFMESAGCPEDLKKIAADSKPELVISKDGDTYVVKVTVGEHTRETRFKPGEQFEGVSVTMQPMKAVVTVEGNKIIEKQTFGNTTVTITREVTGDELASEHGSVPPVVCHSPTADDRMP